MSEDQGKEEEKFDFTSDGEGYISLDEARVLAIRTASQTPGVRSKRYRDVLMAFEVVSATEDEETYDIVLSYRPQGDFTGTPGQEHFIIGKHGEIILSQVWSTPKEPGGLLILPISIGVVVIGIIAAVGTVFVLMGSDSDSLPVAAVSSLIETEGTSETPTATHTPQLASTLAPTQTPQPIPTPTATFTSNPTNIQTSSAVFVTEWGTQGTGNGQFNGINDSRSLLDLAVAPDGSVYVADYQNYRVQKFTSEGMFVTKWGTEGWGGGAFLQPLGVSIASDGNVYVADQSIGVQKFTSDGVFISDWENRPTDEGHWHATRGVAVAPDGSVYIADGSNRIQKFTSDGVNPCVPYGGGSMSMCEGVFVSEWGTTGSGDGQFDLLESVAVAPDGSVYTVEVNNRRIQKFTSEGVFVTKWGTFGDGDGQFWNPNGVTVASDGSVYVADTGNHRIQKFTSEGVFVTKWGTFGTGDGEFDHPRGVAVAPDGSVYVADPVNHRIQKFSMEP